MFYQLISINPSNQVYRHYQVKRFIEIHIDIFFFFSFHQLSTIYMVQGTTALKNKMVRKFFTVYLSSFLTALSDKAQKSSQSFFVSTCDVRRSAKSVILSSAHALTRKIMTFLRYSGRYNQMETSLRQKFYLYLRTFILFAFFQLRR